MRAVAVGHLVQVLLVLVLGEIVGAQVRLGERLDFGGHLAEAVLLELGGVGVDDRLDLVQRQPVREVRAEREVDGGAAREARRVRAYRTAILR